MKLYHVEVKSNSQFMTDAQEADRVLSQVGERVHALGGTAERALGFEIAPTYIVASLPDDVDVSSLFGDLPAKLFTPPVEVDNG